MYSMKLYGSFKVGGLGCINVWFDCNCVATRQKKYDFFFIYMIVVVCYNVDLIVTRVYMAPRAT